MSIPEKVTISDIARQANVSPSTVSRVLRGTTAVSERKHQAVLDAVKALNYRPNIFAQSLASGQSMTIGVLTQRFGSPFYDGILQGILHGLEQTGYSPLFADGRWNPEAETKALQTLIERQIDGLIVIGGRISREELQATAAMVPVILVARELPEFANQSITVKNYDAAYKAVQYLIERGHQNIAHICGPIWDDEVNDISQRYDGYLQALRDSGLTPDPDLIIQGTLQRQSGVIAMESLFARGKPFSAVFAANDQMAFGARLALHRHGVRVPEDVSVVGFDDESSAAFMIPPLTTVRQPSGELGQAAASAILRLLSGETYVSQQFDAQLILRESVVRIR